MPRPQPDLPAGPDVWHVYTDGSSRHERRRTFSGWAARAVQPETQRVRQTSGAGPGGDSLAAETEAIVRGLRLVPSGATAVLHSDLEPAALLAVLQSAEGEAARTHLAQVHAQSILRNTEPHGRAMHDASRAVQDDARAADGVADTGLPNAAHGALAAARAGEATPPQARGAHVRYAGDTDPLRAQVLGVRLDAPAARGVTRATVTLQLVVQGVGGRPGEAVEAAVVRALGTLSRDAVVHVDAPESARPNIEAALQTMPNVRVQWHGPGAGTDSSP